ncbi:unnamed protein product, partial [Prunus brigantina]
LSVKSTNCLVGSLHHGCELLLLALFEPLGCAFPSHGLVTVDLLDSAPRDGVANLLITGNEWISRLIISIVIDVALLKSIKPDQVLHLKADDRSVLNG